LLQKEVINASRSSRLDEELKAFRRFLDLEQCPHLRFEKDSNLSLTSSQWDGREKFFKSIIIALMHNAYMLSRRDRD
jgi:hypothetical protein